MATEPAKPAKPAQQVQLSDKFIQSLKKRSHLSEEEIRTSFDEFRKATPTGQLNQEQFISLWSETAPHTENPDADVPDLGKRVFAYFDRDHSGKVDFNEFLMACALLTPGEPTQRLALLFILCDFNHDGFLSKEEIQQLFQIVKIAGDKVDEKQYEAFKAHLETVFPQYDVNKDGKMSQKEFSNLCMNDEVFKQIIL